VIFLLGHTSGTFPDVILNSFANHGGRVSVFTDLSFPLLSSSHLSIFILPHHHPYLSWNAISTFNKIKYVKIINRNHSKISKNTIK